MLSGVHYDLLKKILFKLSLIILFAQSIERTDFRGIMKPIIPLSYSVSFYCSQWKKSEGTLTSIHSAWITGSKTCELHSDCFGRKSICIKLANGMGNHLKGKLWGLLDSVGKLLLLFYFPEVLWQGGSWSKRLQASVGTAEEEEEVWDTWESHGA